jgi:hypothetical protein
VRADAPGMALWPLVAGAWAALIAVVGLVFASRRRGMVTP